MRKEIDAKGQLSMIDHTPQGEQSVRFYGKYVRTKSHQKELITQAWKMINNYCNGEFWTTVEWVSITGFAGAARILRKINRGEFEGYAREEKRNTELGSKYRIVKK